MALFVSSVEVRLVYGEQEPGRGLGERKGGAQGEPAESIDSINEGFAKGLERLERERLQRLARLAAGQGKEDATKTYEVYLRLAIESRLYRDAEGTAERVLTTTNPSSRAFALAALVNLIAEADRGAYDESLASLAAAFQRARPESGGVGSAPKASLPRAARLRLAEAYYQRLLQGDRFQIARQAFQMIQTQAEDKAIKDYAENRLRQLDMIGKPAPAILGTDMDGKTVRLADLKGDVVLIVFWATWYVPGARDVADLDLVYDTYRRSGFRVLGVNLDTAQDGGEKVETVLPNIRRFLLDYNVRWPSLINGTGDRNYAEAYAVKELPANVLIGRDGTVIHRDLTRSNLERVVGKALGR